MHIYTNKIRFRQCVFNDTKGYYKNEQNNLFVSVVDEMRNSELT